MYSISCIRKGSIVINSRRIDEALFTSTPSKFVKSKFIKEFETLSQLAKYICESYRHLYYGLNSLDKNEMVILRNKVKSLTDSRLLIYKKYAYYEAILFNEEQENRRST